MIDLYWAITYHVIDYWLPNCLLLQSSANVENATIAGHVVYKSRDKICFNFTCTCTYITLSVAQELNPVDKMSENAAIEEETHDLPIGVGIKDLRKVFKVLQPFKMGFH